MRGLRDILRMILMFVKSLCVGDGEATMFLLPTRKGILIDPRVYNEFRVKDIRIVTWDNPLYDSHPSKHYAYTTITIDSIDEY